MDLATIFGAVAADATDAISTAAPLALGVAGSLLAVRVGWRLVRGFVK